MIPTVVPCTRDFNQFGVRAVFADNRRAVFAPRISTACFCVLFIFFSFVWGVLFLYLYIIYNHFIFVSIICVKNRSL